MYPLAKRTIDVCVSAVALLALSPLLLVISLFVLATLGRPVLFRQTRPGLGGRAFSMVKFRTMLDSTDRDGRPLDDAVRLTRVGKALRATSLDELPELWNVLKGEMSLIGPRPERPQLEHDLERQIPHYRKRHWMRPGLSGWAQVCAPYASSVEDSDLKLSYDLYYLRHFSTWLDFVILFRTVKTVLKATGR